MARQSRQEQLRKLRDKLRKVMNLAKRPGSAGEGAAARKQAKRLQERIDGLEGRDTARDAAQEAENHQSQDDSLKEFWRKREAESRRAREANEQWDAENQRAEETGEHERQARERYRAWESAWSSEARKARQEKQNRWETELAAQRERAQREREEQELAESRERRARARAQREREEQELAESIEGLEKVLVPLFLCSPVPAIVASLMALQMLISESGTPLARPYADYAVFAIYWGVWGFFGVLALALEAFAVWAREGCAPIIAMTFVFQFLAHLTVAEGVTGIAVSAFFLFMVVVFSLIMDALLPDRD